MTLAQPFSDYEILERVGVGAMGTVWKAQHKRLGRVVALKVLKPSLGSDARYVERLRREARLVAALNHPNIVTGHDLGEEGGYQYFVMEFVEGRSLRSLLGEWGMFSEEWVRQVARQVAHALDHAWQRGVIHRDVKPGNILIDVAGNVKLTDLGLAKGPTDASLTRDGATLGTPYYISPEQARDPETADVRSDLYSLGATLYHMATGVPPFQGATLAEVLTSVMSEAPVSPLAINPGLSEEMSLVIRKLLAKDPALRYQTPRELLDDLDRIDTALRPLVDAGRLARAEGGRAGGGRRWWRLAAVALPVLLIGGWGAWALGLTPNAEQRAAARAAVFLDAIERQSSTWKAGPRALWFRAMAKNAPPEALRGLDQRRVFSEREAARAVAAVAAKLTADQPALRARLRDPASWPSAADVARDVVAPALREDVGVTFAELAELPETARAALAPFDATLASLLQERDGDLVAAFERHCTTEVARSAAEALARDDFLAAEAVCREALLRFLDGVARPLVSRLDVAVRGRLQQAHQDGQQAVVRDVVEPAEAAIAAALLAEADAAAAACEQLVRETRFAAAAQVELARARAELARRWPPAERFRPGRSPWRQVEARLAAAEREVELACALQRANRSRARWDLAWNVALRVGAVPALAALGDEPPAEPAAAAAWAAHRRVLQAAVAVEHALSRQINGSPFPVMVAPSDGGAPRKLQSGRRADGVLGSTSELAIAPSIVVVTDDDGRDRPLAMADLQPAALLGLLPPDRIVETMPAAATAMSDFALGSAAWSLAGGDLDAFARRLPTLADGDERALVEEVAPTLARVRGSRPDEAAARLAAFQALQQQLDAASGGAGVDGLESALARCGALVPDQDRTDAEATLAASARALLVRIAREHRLRRALTAAAPAGAGIEIVGSDAGAVGAVTMPVKVLAAVAPSGWTDGDGALRAAGGLSPREADAAALRATMGFEPNVGDLEVEFAVRLPDASGGLRAWVFVVRGVAVALCVDGAGAVRARVVRGDPARDENVTDAIVRALASDAPAAVVTPGAAHGLVIEVVPSAQRTTALVSVSFDGVALCSSLAVRSNPRWRRPSPCCRWRRSRSRAWSRAASCADRRTRSPAAGGRGSPRADAIAAGASPAVTGAAAARRGAR